MPQPLLFRLIDKAVIDYNMIEKGDRILVGASGGKDSTALLEYLAHRSRRTDAGFSFCALHIATEFGGTLPEKITSLFQKWEIDIRTLQIDVQGRLKAGRKMSCYWCSTQRRTELLHFALENGFNKIALGHHLDDALETLLMNALEKGVFSAMPPALRYNKYPITLIRPLYYAAVEAIQRHAEERGYAGWTCSCNFQDNSTRRDARRRLALLTDGNSAQKTKLLYALKNIRSDYLP